MADKKSFIVYNDWRNAFDKIPDEAAGKLIKAIFAFANGEDISDLDWGIVGMLEQYKSIILRDAKKWEDQVEQRSIAGKKSAEARERKAAEANDRSTTVEFRERKPTDSNSESNSDSKSESNIPSIEEVESFAVEYSIRHKKDKQQCIDLANKGWNNYINADWKDVKGNKVKNWKIKLSNSYLSLDKLNDAVDPALEKYNKSFAWLTTNGGNRMFEDIDFCLKAYNSGEASAEEKLNLENVLKYKQLI
jgi:hypothetical protein